MALSSLSAAEPVRTNCLSLVEIPAVPGGAVATRNSLTIYGNRTTVRFIDGAQPFALVNNADFDGVTGAYGGAASGGNDIALVAVPEPLSGMLLLAGTLLLGLRRRHDPKHC